MKHINKYILECIKTRSVLIFIVLSTFTSCFDDYLDIVPDNVATIDNAFSMRVTAERFLFTCYSWLPAEENVSNSPALMNSDELWSLSTEKWLGWQIARGNQGIIDPYVNYWDGENGGIPMFRAIRECNIFLENVGKVPDLSELEKNYWIGEIKFLKAYYHFLLLRMYGPIPIIDENLPISSSPEEVKIYREPIDKCFEYIVNTMDDAIKTLPDKIVDETTQKGRVDKCVALSMKAQVLVYAASPLFNGNTDYISFVDHNATPFFNQTFESTKWNRAAEACKEAVEFCEANGFVLHRFKPSAIQEFSETTNNQLSFREAMTERTSQELIWGNVKAYSEGGQRSCIARGVVSGVQLGGTASATLKMAELFYTDNGVPIEEDKFWNYGNRYGLRVVRPEESINLINGYTTVELNFNREDRFYGSLGFDGGCLFGQGRVDESNQYNINMKYGQSAGIITSETYMVTGYFPKKMINYQTTFNGSAINPRGYPWPTMRLANLYLLYAEALNESIGPNPESIRMLDMIRERSGLKGIEESWNNYSNNPNKYKTKEGLRDIIQRERSIELMFEGHRAWDIRRWKTVIQECNSPVRGWNMSEKTEEAYYRPVNLFDQTFTLKDYFWPIKEYSLQVNRNLIQNPGW